MVGLYLWTVRNHTVINSFIDLKNLLGLPKVRLALAVESAVISIRMLSIILSLVANYSYFLYRLDGDGRIVICGAKRNE